MMPENVKVIMMHGYDTSGTVFGIELPAFFDEGRRGETGWRAYDAKKVGKEFNGTLVRGNGNYYELLKDYSSIIDRYKE